MNKEVNNLINKFGEEYSNDYFETLMAYQKIIIIGQNNNGYITSKEVSENSINRQYISMLGKKGAIEKVTRGIYVLKGVVLDDFYIFQLKYPKTIFSHNTALYFYNLTEEFPYKFDITCSRSYNVKSIKDNNIFYVDKDLIELGKIKIETKYGNVINIYDIERTICDIIRNDNRMDGEQLIKSLVDMIMHKKIKIDMHKLSEYSKKLKCYDKVMKVVSYYDY